MLRFRDSIECRLLYRLEAMWIGSWLESIEQFIILNGMDIRKQLTSLETLLQSMSLQIIRQTMKLPDQRVHFNLGYWLHHFAVDIWHSFLKFNHDNFSLCNSHHYATGAPAEQGFYRWTKKHGIETLPGKHQTATSLAYDYTRNTLYLIEGCIQTLWAYKINRKTEKFVCVKN